MNNNVRERAKSISLRNETNKLDIASVQKNQSQKGCVLVTEIEERKSKNGPYCLLTITDGKEKEKAKYWNSTPSDLPFEKEAVITVDIIRDNYGLVINRFNSDYDGEFGIDDFIVKAPIDSQEMFDEIIEILDSVPTTFGSNSLIDLVKRIYEKYHDMLMYWSAAVAKHHNFYGGLLYHTLRMVKTAECIANIYESVDKELLLSATALHDIGKLKEFEVNKTGETRYSKEGSLFGHLQLGIGIIEEEANKHSYNQERIMCLKHCVASHHGKKEYGAITPPQIEEAILLYFIDMIDSRAMIYETNKNNINPGSFSDNYIKGLLDDSGVRIYNPVNSNECNNKESYFDDKDTMESDLDGSFSEEIDSLPF